MNENDLLTTTQAAEVIDKDKPPVRFLENLRRTGGGPVFVKLSHRFVRYRRKDIDAWVESNLRTSTSDNGDLDA
ncbi:MAG: helix-turn-helix domain-containing protein [Candidatus Obscuribacterales bacterium]|nr:helix-turn-helix domain-containing protein [Candidatus Obscuribacterales bacterium]